LASAVIRPDGTAHTDVRFTHVANSVRGAYVSRNGFLEALQGRGALRAKATIGRLAARYSGTVGRLVTLHPDSVCSLFLAHCAITSDALHTVQRLPLFLGTWLPGTWYLVAGSQYSDLDSNLLRDTLLVPSGSVVVSRLSPLRAQDQRFSKDLHLLQPSC
jgi:hypothetical protein